MTHSSAERRVAESALATTIMMRIYLVQRKKDLADAFEYAEALVEAAIGIPK